MCIAPHTFQKSFVYQNVVKHTQKYVNRTINVATAVESGTAANGAIGGASARPTRKHVLVVEERVTD